MHPQEKTARVALHTMAEALQLLDEAELPADIGAHLDLAIERLRDHMFRRGWERRGPIH